MSELTESSIFCFDSCAFHMWSWTWHRSNRVSPWSQPHRPFLNTCTIYRSREEATRNLTTFVSVNFWLNAFPLRVSQSAHTLKSVLKHLLKLAINQHLCFQCERSHWHIRMKTRWINQIVLTSNAWNLLIQSYLLAHLCTSAPDLITTSVTALLSLLFSGD